jgi:ATP-dependent helicase/nuclease subunit B
MPADVFLILGPLASGKTDSLLTRYRAVTEEHSGGCLWLAPTERARDGIRSRLGSPDGASANLFTFPDFARQIVRTAEPAARTLPELHQRFLLDDVLAAAARDGETPDFAAVVESRGLADAVFGFLTELKGQGIAPAEFEETLANIARGNPSLARQANRNAPGRGRAEQVAALYARYQKRLSDGRLLDREATYERARELWAADRRAPFAAVRAVFVDGFIDFTPPQLKLLAAVTESVKQVWITVLTDRTDDASRNELFARPQSTLACLRQLWNKRREVQADTAATFAPPLRPAGLEHLEKSLFRPETPPPSADADGVQLIEAPGLVGEVRMAARAVKTLLLDGTSPDAVVITARDLGPYVDLIREVFAEYGVPVEVDGTDPLIRCPAVAVLLRAVRLLDDDFPFAATTALLRNSYLRPDWVEVTALPDVAAHAEILLRLLGEPKGKDAYLRAARQWAAEQGAGLEDEAAEESRRRRKHELAKRCLPFLEQFFAAWNSMPEKEYLPAFVEWLRTFASDLGLMREAERTDAASWERFWSDLEGWAGQEKHLHGQSPPHTRETFQKLLGILAASIGIARGAAGPGRVRVVPPEQARHVDCDQLFLLGLGERSFPAVGGSDPLFDDGDRLAFRTAGLEIRCATDRLPDEMLLFYQLVTRPRRRLVLSRPAVDDAGQQLLPSSFLTAAVVCFAPDTVPVERRRMLIEGFDRDRPLGSAEYRVRWAASSGVAAGPLTADLVDHLRTASRIAAARFRNSDHSQYDGLLRSPTVLTDLAQRFGPTKVLSPTSLENYVACPFRFFLEQVLKVEPLEDPAEEVEHTRRGAAVHRALSRLHNQLKDEKSHAPPEGLGDRFIVELNTAVEEYAGRVSSPAARVLWRLEAERLARSARRYPVQWEMFQEPWREQDVDVRPERFEIDFGLAGAEHGPLVIRVGDTEVRIGGRVDRIDVTEFDDGSLGFWVIDYKTGSSQHHTAKAITEMRKLQLSLYALAIERVVLVDARPLGLAYWMVAENGPKLTLPGSRTPTAWLAAADHWPRFREQLEQWVATLVGRIRGGEFPLHPRTENCTDTCPYGQVCRISQARSVEKNWDLPLPMQANDDDE